jgi:predicted transcriptional regulator
MQIIDAFIERGRLRRRAEASTGDSSREIVMQTHSAKQRALEAIEQLPDNLPMDEIVYRRYVLNKVHQGLDDVDAGRVVSSEALAAEIEQW